PVLRRGGGSASTGLPLKCVWAAGRPAKPAIVRSSVVLPQPDGPSSVKNALSATSSDTSSAARTVPNDRDTWSIEITVKTSPATDKPLIPEDRAAFGAAVLLDKVDERQRVLWITSLMRSIVSPRFCV